MAESWNPMMPPDELNALFAKPRSAQHAYHVLKNKNNLKTLAKMLGNPELYPTLEWNIVQQTPLSVVDLVYFNILRKQDIQAFRITNEQMESLGREQQRYLLRLYKCPDPDVTL